MNRTGRKLSEETKKKISESSFGRKHSNETRKKIGEGNRGKTASLETKRKMRESAKNSVFDSKECIECSTLYKPKNGSQKVCVDCVTRFHRGQRLQEMYSITNSQYDNMLIVQNGVCAICKSKETFKTCGKVISLAVDHNHETNKVRGLLCKCCNQALGSFKDSSTLLRIAADYLDERNGDVT